MRKAFLVCFLIFAGALSATAQSTFYFPRLADGVQGGGIFWKTTMFLTNPAPVGSAAVTGTITLFNSSGLPLSLSFLTEAGQTVSGSTLQFSLSGGQTRKFASGGTAPLATGYAIVSASGALSGTAVFSEYGGSGQLVGEAGAAAGSASTRQTIVVDTTIVPGLGPLQTGVAYSNVGTTAAAVSLSLLNSSGVAVVPSVNTTLGGRAHFAGFVSGIFAGAPAFVGSMQITSDVPLSVIALRFDPTFSLFTTLPPVQLALNWLDQKPWLSAVGSFARLLAGLHFHAMA